MFVPFGTAYHPACVFDSPFMWLIRIAQNAVHSLREPALETGCQPRRTGELPFPSWYHLVLNPCHLRRERIHFLFRHSSCSRVCGCTFFEPLTPSFKTLVPTAVECCLKPHPFCCCLRHLAPPISSTKAHRPINGLKCLDLV